MDLLAFTIGSLGGRTVSITFAVIYSSRTDDWNLMQTCWIIRHCRIGLQRNSSEANQIIAYSLADTSCVYHRINSISTTMTTRLIPCLSQNATVLVVTVIVAVRWRCIVVVDIRWRSTLVIALRWGQRHLFFILFHQQTRSSANMKAYRKVINIPA